MNYLKLQTQAYKQMLLGQYEESIRDHEICIKLKPNDVTNFWYLGLSYFFKGNELEAQAIWMTILMSEISEKKKSQTVDLLKILEKELMKQIKTGNLELAKRLEIQIKDIDEKYFIEQLEQAIEETIEKLFKKANQLKKQKNYQEAETKYQQILFWNHQNDEAWYQLGLLYFHVFEYGKALDCVMNSISLNPSAGKYHYNVGLILEKLKQIPKSIKAYYKALELDPSLVVAYHQLGNLLSSIGELEEAEKINRQAKEILLSHCKQILF